MADEPAAAREALDRTLDDEVPLGGEHPLLTELTARVREEPDRALPASPLLPTSAIRVRPHLSAETRTWSITVLETSVR